MSKAVHYIVISVSINKVLNVKSNDMKVHWNNIEPHTALHQFFTSPHTALHQFFTSPHIVLH
jgi:hypothetical protein